METSLKCKDVIKSFEGLRLTPYICAGGYLTVGWGHVLNANVGKKGEFAARLAVEPNTVISYAQAERFFEADILHAENAIRRLIRVPLTQGQFDALVSFTFNLGAGALQRSTLRSKINRNESLIRCAVEFDKWVYSKGRRLRGLILRRKVEKKMFLSSYMPDSIPMHGELYPDVSDHVPHSKPDADSEAAHVAIPDLRAADNKSWISRVINAFFGGLK